MARRLVLILTGLAACRAEFGSFGGGGAGTTDGAGGDRDVVTSAGGAGAVGGTGGTGGAVAEACASGEDEDGDGLVDCEDLDDCGGYFCVALPEALDDWEGPIALLVSGKEGCDPGSEAGPQLSLLTNAPEVCGCTCGDASGQSCRAELALDCAGPSQAIMPNAACVPVGDVVNGVTAPTRPTGGSCVASPSSAVPAYDVRNTCTAPRGGGCADGICLRPGAPSIVEATCFAKEGLHPCDVGPFQERHLAYEDPPASVGCEGACACGAPTGGDCSGDLALFQDAGCTTALGVAQDACTPFGAPTTIGSVRYNAGATISDPGTCVTAPRPLSAADVTTLCCAPGL